VLNYGKYILEDNMNRSEKGIELVRAINHEWLEELEKDESLYGILMNEPFTDEYWEEKYKIVLCNLEGYDQSRNEKVLGLDCFRIWIERKNRTIKRSALFLHCLYNKLVGIDIKKEQIVAAKNDNELLLNSMKKVTYMNLLKDANGQSKFDKKYFDDFFSDEKNKKNTIALIEALTPDVFVVTSEGISLIEQLFGKKFDDHIFFYNNILFVALGHPRACFTDEYILYWVNKIKDILEKNLRNH
jgi:hypothetical protein